MPGTSTEAHPTKIDFAGGHARLVLRFQGKGVDALRQEAGIHRVQRVPDNERRGRVHTSTVGVVVLADRPVAQADGDLMRDEDLRMEWFNGTTKAGGQHHQKNACCCRLIHVPTGKVRTAQTRSRKESLRLAKEAMLADLRQSQASAAHAQYNAARHAGLRGQDDFAGPLGGRGAPRRRTWRFQDDRVVDHETGKEGNARRLLAGGMDALWREGAGNVDEPRSHPKAR